FFCFLPTTPSAGTKLPSKKNKQNRRIKNAPKETKRSLRKPPQTPRGSKWSNSRAVHAPQRASRHHHRATDRKPHDTLNWFPPLSDRARHRCETIDSSSRSTPSDERPESKGGRFCTSAAPTVPTPEGERSRSVGRLGSGVREPPETGVGERGRAALSSSWSARIEDPSQVAQLRELCCKEPGFKRASNSNPKR
ncbi:unnamed protein product, partial [Ixodes persulcatus]